jgi:hypothetical protein
MSFPDTIHLFLPIKHTLIDAINASPEIIGITPPFGRDGTRTAFIRVVHFRYHQRP